jgi:pimeloyl-ACP methyl ester carboxylesterase
MTSMRRRLFVVLALLSALALPHQALGADLEDLGVVFLHGKGLWAGAFDGGLTSALHEAGAKVLTPEMPWSFDRMYDATYEQAMREIDAAVAKLRAQGLVQIVVIGHSLGANAAIGYAASHGPLAAVVAIAPGHLPEVETTRYRTHDSRVEAARLIANRQGDVPHPFVDAIQNIQMVVTATPTVYLSMFDPNGPAVIPKNAAAMPAVPFLWVAGKFDGISPLGREYAFTLAAKHSKSRYVEVVAGHFSVARMARTTILDWLKSL